MEKGKITISIAALYAEPKENSEMISQCLFGETFEILEKQNLFSKIKADDGFEGWLSDLHYEINKDNTVTTILDLAYLERNHQLFSLGSELLEYHSLQTPALEREAILKTALRFVNVPFLHGGRSFFGTDAAAFIQLVFKAHGIALPRLASQQINFGEILAFVEESETGDLAFFDNEEGEIIHVGMMIENYQILHCYGKVRIDSLDSTGIFNKELGKYTHKLRFVKSIL